MVLAFQNNRQKMYPGNSTFSFFFEPGKQLGKPPLLDFIKTQKQPLYKTKGNTPAKPKRS
jgi:hypothetical protein